MAQFLIGGYNIGESQSCRQIRGRLLSRGSRRQAHRFPSGSVLTAFGIVNRGANIMVELRRILSAVSTD
jgi:hypothetical protein